MSTPGRDNTQKQVDTIVPTRITKPSQRRLFQARVAVFVYFVAHGATLALWVVSIPVIKNQLRLDDHTLGLVLLSLAIGAVLTVQLIGRQLLRRYPTRYVTHSCGVLIGLSLILTSLAGNALWLVAALFLFGGLLGLLDSSMNAHAAQIEVCYGRPLMSTFHAAWSLSCVVTTFTASALFKTQWSLTEILCGYGFLLVGCCFLAGHWLLSAADSQPHTSSKVTNTHHRFSRQVWLLAAIALGALMCQGAVGDWAGVHLQESFGVSKSFAAYGYGAFTIAMTVGRFMGDRITRAIGPVYLLRFSSALAAVGTILAAAALHPALTITGWAITGLGLAGIPPLLYSASANTKPDGHIAVTQVSSAAYFGMLVGPPIIGFLAKGLGLSNALLILVVIFTVIAFAAPIVKPSESPQAE